MNREKRRVFTGTIVLGKGGCLNGGGVPKRIPVAAIKHNMNVSLFPESAKSV